MVEAVAARLADAGEELRRGRPHHHGHPRPAAQGAAGRHRSPRARGTGGRGAPLYVASGGMSTDAATLPDALSDAARSFAAGPHRLVIGGERPEAADGRTFETFDPATGRVIADVPHAGAEDVDRAVRAAREAFEDGRWTRDRGRRAHARDARVRRRHRRARRRACRARVARQRQAGEDGEPRGRAARLRAPALLRGLAHAHQRRGAAGGAAEHALLHAQGAGRRGGADHPLELPAR